MNGPFTADPDALRDVNPAHDGADSMCYEDASTGEDETPLPCCAKQHGDNPKNSERPRLGNGKSLVDGPFGSTPA